MPSPSQRRTRRNCGLHLHHAFYNQEFSCGRSGSSSCCNRLKCVPASLSLRQTCVPLGAREMVQFSPQTDSGIKKTTFFLLKTAFLTFLFLEIVIFRSRTLYSRLTPRAPRSYLISLFGSFRIRVLDFLKVRMPMFCAFCDGYDGFLMRCTPSEGRVVSLP